MPVNVPDRLPAIERLAEENIFVMTETRARTQDIRPLQIGVVNLMPTKEVTETQLLRLLGNTPLQVDVTFIKMASHTAKNASPYHMETFYRTFEECKGKKFDGLVITGAPVEQIDFEEVHYWDELKSIMDWAQKNVFSTFYICWAAQAGLYYRYGVEKYPLAEKCSGVFAHRVVSPRSMLMRGFDEVFSAPHSRHTEVRASDVEKVKDIQILAVSDEAGLFAAKSSDNKHIFVTGHAEYDRDTLKMEYLRDVGKGMDIKPPANYFPDDDPSREPLFTWRAHANLLFANWLNYYVYQETPFDLESIGK